MKEKTFSVYKHTTPSGKVYIGITSRENPEYRWCNGEGYKNNAHFYNAIKKYGWENIVHEIIATGLTKAAACDLEKMLIQTYNSTDVACGYNRSIGGELSSLGVVRTEEQKRHLSEINKGKSTGKQSEETIRKRSESLKRAYAEGRRIPRIFTEEEQRKAHEKHRGMKHNFTEEGHKRQLEAIKRGAETRRGKPHPVNNKNSRPIAQMLYGEVINIFGSISEAKRSGFKSSRIRDCCQGKQLKANGYEWEYI